MGKISPVSIKYNIIADIKLTSIADKSDVIGAIFGQTEGLLGSDLELRELQKAGKIGRIKVDLKSHNGKSQGKVIIPSSMGKSETAIIAASLETIDRVGPCNAKISTKRIEDVRISKRDFILDRAKYLLKDLVTTLPDSQEFTNKVTQTVRTLEVIDYGEDKLPAGPMIDNADEIIVVEGRADVVNLLKYGIRNVLGLNGTKSMKTIVKLSKEKEITLFVDGDRGGDLITRKLLESAEIDFVCRAPDGKEVEELTMKEIQKALRAREPVEHVETEKAIATTKTKTSRTRTRDSRTYNQKTKRTAERTTEIRNKVIEKNLEDIKKMSDELVGTRGAFLLDETMNILGKVPVKELKDTLRNMSENAHLIIMDGNTDSDIVRFAERKRVRYIISSDKSAKRGRVNIIPSNQLAVA